MTGFLVPPGMLHGISLQLQQSSAESKPLPPHWRADNEPSLHFHGKLSIQRSSVMNAVSNQAEKTLSCSRREKLGEAGILSRNK